MLTRDKMNGLQQEVLNNLDQLIRTTKQMVHQGNEGNHIHLSETFLEDVASRLKKLELAAFTSRTQEKIKHASSRSN